MFVSSSTFLFRILSFSERLCKPVSRLGYILEFEAAENRTFLMSIKIVNRKSILTDPNLITSWELGVIDKYCRGEVLFAVVNTYESDPKREKAIDTALHTYGKMV